MTNKPARVAIVEDNRTTRESLASLVSMEVDMECVGICETAEEAVDKVSGMHPDIILMDIQLPNMSGVQCAQIIKEAMPEVLIVMLTVYEDPQRIFAALRAGACGYILKRSGPDEILGGIRDALGGGVPMTGEIARKVIAQFRQPVKAAREIYRLSDREREILELLAQGFSNKEIAARLNVSVETVRWHLKHIYDKLHVGTRTEAAMKLHQSTDSGLV